MTDDPKGPVGDPAAAERPPAAPSDRSTRAADESLNDDWPALPAAGGWSPPGYEVLGELGRGGMGVVLKAREIEIGRFVALKAVLAGRLGGKNALERFKREAAAIGKLDDHPHIVRIYAYGSHEETPYFALEYLEGGSLDRLAGRSPLSPLRVAALLEQLASAIQHAHEGGILHRDLKPSNVLLASFHELPNGEVELGTAKLADFGLAHLIDEDRRLTRAGNAIGTPSYMAPEQATRQDDRLGPATDVYGLGGILYWLLTGTPPFDAPTDFEVMTAVVNQPPEPPRVRNPACPPALEAICLRCLEKNPRDRYPSTAALIDDLRRFQNGQPTTAPSRRFSRRAWLAGAAAAALAVPTTAYFLMRPSKVSLRLGLLLPTRGPFAVSADGVAAAVRAAVDELAEQRTEIEVLYAEDDTPAEARRLVVDERADALLGAWSSPSRKALLPVLKELNTLLIYPLEFEGLEQSEHVVYLGALPNQLFVPAVKRLLRDQPGKRLFVVGPNTIYGVAVAKILGVEPSQVRLVADGCNPPDCADCQGAARAAIEAKPALLVNLLRGRDSNLALFQALRDAGATSMPTVSFSLTDEDERSFCVGSAVGSYLGSSYFEKLDSPANARFLERLGVKYDLQRRAVFDAMEAAYCGVHLWALAVRKAGTSEAQKVREALADVEFEGPGGKVWIDAATGCAFKMARLAQIGKEGNIQLVDWQEGPTAPVPFPPTRSEGGTS